ncbi:GNAT family N-acetyltransferase [Oscillatoria sp. FACHB-1407]|uniref:GNAT family N-acetyltransferase n=1 Tax=Oscillatoria sp. FACHB-1407 TaxID=2692847 RepID=UPI001F5592A4|nr:GNAT family N-acetyltransferase [Oscillatoria sp. FACHB-1407]
MRQDGYTIGQAELGIEAPQYWGHYAYAIEVGKALIDFGFRNFGLREIIGISVNANLRVSRLAERMDFRRSLHNLVPTGCERGDGTRLNGSLQENHGSITCANNGRS